MLNPITDLSELLRTIEPVLNPGTFVFASVETGTNLDPAVILASIKEPEGLSVVMREADAQQYKVPILLRCAWITLSVTSDLQAVGLTAAFAAALAGAAISCNVVAGAYHDHIFVPVQSAERAMQELRSLQRKANADVEDG
jgi:hypothetical protein